MKLIKKILFVVLIIIGVGVLLAIDITDRGIFYSQYIPEDELKEFHLYETIDEVKEAYERNYENPQCIFPRKNVEKVKIYKN